MAIAKSCFNCNELIGSTPVQFSEAKKHGVPKDTLIESGIDMCDDCYSLMMEHQEYVEYCSNEQYCH